jgi:drug/metabolite transporter (DMT)-like permease
VLVGVLTLRIGRPLSGRGPWIALGIATLGAALAVGGVDAGHLPPLGGIALAVASPIIYSGWIVLSARLGGERRDRAGDDGDGGAGAAVASAFMMTATGGLFLMLALATAHPIAPAAIPSGAWPGIIGIGVFSTFIAIQTFYGGARRIGAAPAALISTIEPAYTIVMAALLFGERLTPIQLAGGGLIIGAVILAQTTSRSADAPVELRLADE